MLIGDFNARSSSWWSEDITTRVGRELEALTSTSEYSQLIDKPTHFFNGGSSCIDLIFCNKPEFVLEYGIDHSLFQTCHHNIIFAKISAKFALPPDYEREVWDYKKANIDGIQKSISLFNWERAFNNLSVNEKVDMLNSNLLNIFCNYIPDKTVKCSYKDPPWITKLIKSKLKHKSKLTTKYYEKGHDPIVFDKLMNVSRECTEFILNSKMNYIKNKSNIPNDKKVDPKVYWTVLNYFLNNIKVPSIPPIFSNGKTITNIVDKANLFDDFFASQCTPLDNTSTLPPFLMKTNKSINSINFNGDDIISIIKTLDSKKAHGVDNIAIGIIKLCGDSIILPLTLIFEECIAKGIFPDLCKLANVIPIYKKESKNIVKNYQPVSLLPIFAKISLFFHFYENKLFTECQSGFLPGDSCVSQLLSIVHEIQSSFDSSLEVRAVFLDISKAFDKAWHPGLLFKLKSSGIEGNLLKLLENYLHNRKQRVVLNGQCSSWKNILSGVPQGSVLGLLLFLIYINDLPDGIYLLCKIFADDTSIFSKVHNKHLSQTNLNNDIRNITEWGFQMPVFTSAKKILTNNL